MNRIVLALAALIAATHSATAGIVIVEEVDQTGPMPGKTPMTMTISGDRARIDVGRQLSSIVDLKAGTVTSLMHAQKIAMQLPKAALDAVKEKVAARGEKPDLKPTGKKETISGFACEEYTGAFQGLDVTYWVTRDVANQKEILEQMGRLSGDGDPFKAALAGGGDFPGFPIRTTVKSPQIGVSTMTVLSIKNADVPASQFEVPADYKTVAVPQMSQPGGNAPAAPAGPNGN
ncbi:MAG: DUF4412 domain-containing protein [Terrimicrobiaceae bacterium]|nr:DUF4412 domain-containing protein [Terrimicrobiaceae bacterium]